MNVDVQELRQRFGSKKPSRSIEDLVKYLMESGTDPSKITHQFLADVYGYRRSSIWKILKNYGGLTNIVKNYLHYYRPSISFKEALERLCIGNRTCRIDEVYAVMLKREEGFLHDIVKELRVSRECVRKNARTLNKMGLIVLMNYFDNKSKLLFRILLQPIQPEDLKVSKNIRKKENLELLLLLRIFGKRKRREIAKLYEKETSTLASQLSRIVEREWILIEEDYLRLSEDIIDTIGRIELHLRNLDERGFLEWYLDRWKKLKSHRRIIGDSLAEVLKERIKKRGMNLKQVSGELGIPYNSFRAYLRGYPIPPDRLTLLVKGGYMRLEEMETCEIARNTMTIKQRLKILRRYRLDFLVENVNRAPLFLRKKVLDHVISKSLRDIRRVLCEYGVDLMGDSEEEMLGRAYKMLREFPTYRVLQELGGKCSVWELVNRQKEKRWARDVLREIEILKDAGLIEIHGWRVEVRDLHESYRKLVDYLLTLYGSKRKDSP